MPSWRNGRWRFPERSFTLRRRFILCILNIMKIKSIERIGLLMSLSSVAFFLSGCGGSDVAGDAETTPAHLAAAQGVSAELGSGAGADALASAPMATQDYVIQKGDTLGGLATKFGVSIDAIKEVNGMDSDTIFYGKTIKIPAPAGTPASQIANAAESQTAPVSAPEVINTPTTTTTSTPSTTPESTAPTNAPVQTAPVSNAVDNSLPVVPPAPPTGNNTSSSETEPQSGTSIGAAFGGGDKTNDTTTAPQPRMPGASSISPFYDNADTGVNSIPPISGQPKSGEDVDEKPSIPLPRE